MAQKNGMRRGMSDLQKYLDEEISQMIAMEALESVRSWNEGEFRVTVKIERKEKDE